MDHEYTDVPPAAPVQESLEDKPPAVLTQEDRQWGMFAHLSALAGLLVGGFTFVGPLVIWLIKKDESKFVDANGKEALNFQLNILIYYLVSIAITFATCGIAFPLPLALMIYATVMPIVAGLKANEGQVYEYPLTFRIIK
jgi:uncharacterized Tic20 family protein